EDTRLFRRESQPQPNDRTSRRKANPCRKPKQPPPKLGSERACEATHLPTGFEQCLSEHDRVLGVITSHPPTPDESMPPLPTPTKSSNHIWPQTFSGKPKRIADHRAEQDPRHPI
ncbi:MAG: hypothetical protein WBG04_19260, partial [Haloferula sp.]